MMHKYIGLENINMWSQNKFRWIWFGGFGGDIVTMISCRNNMNILVVNFTQTEAQTS